MNDLTIWKLDVRSDVLLEPFPLDPPPASLNDTSAVLPAGVYTTFRTFEGKKILAFEHHIRRLEESAALLGKEIHLNRALIREAVRQALQEIAHPEARVRITVGLAGQPESIFLALEPLHLPSPQDYERGVWVVTCRHHRNNPLAKQTAFISEAETIRQKLPAGANDALMVDVNGRILEGLSSNFFAVRDGVIWTAGDAVLAGVTRSLVLELAERAGLPVHVEQIPTSDLGLFQEAFLTSSSRSVLPVRQIDEIVLGNGTVGPITQRLMHDYAQEVHQKLVQDEAN